MRAKLVSVLALAGALLGGGCSDRPTAPSGAGPHTYLGLSANPTDGAPADSFGSALLTARATGVNFFYLNPLWSDFEPTPRSYQTAQLENQVAALQSLGFVVYLNLRTVDTNQRGMPADIAALPFSDASVIARMDSVVDQLVTLALNRQLFALALGNEVDVYFGAHPTEFAGFRALYQREVGRIKLRYPGLRVGVTTTSPVNNPNAGFGTQLNASSDIAIYTYYPFQPGTDFVHRPPSTLEPDFDAMRATVAGKPWALQEIGYTNATANGSSDSLQADFVRRFRVQVATLRSSDLLFANWFLFSDWSSATLNRLFAYYGAYSPGFAAYLGHLGLRDSTGAPKSAWRAWRGVP